MLPGTSSANGLVFFMYDMVFYHLDEAESFFAGVRAY